MNNSDIIAALSLAVTAIIFLVQNDDGLLKLKVKQQEKWRLGLLIILIILLVNHQVFERINFTFYFKFGKWYLQPGEWALVIFLFLIGLTLYRIFKPKIFNENPKTIFELIEKYRAEKKWLKLHNLLLQVMEIKEFETQYAERLNDTVFNDHHLIEYFASDFPSALIRFSDKYKAASINQGEHLFYILNGLFADKSNLIFSEINNYPNDPDKNIFLNDLWTIQDKKIEYSPDKNYHTKLPIISWLTKILASYPSNLKEEIAYFLNQFPYVESYKINERIYTEKEIERSLSRDALFNCLRLFRILLVELSFTDQKASLLMDRVLVIFYSAWDYILKYTRPQEEVALDNDSYTINEYSLKYLFNGYSSLFMLHNYIIASKNDFDNKDWHSNLWILKMLFAKIDTAIGSYKISERSKKYYLEDLIELYFQLPEYFKQVESSYIDKLGNAILWQLKDSLTKTPYGNVILFDGVFKKVCETYEFYRNNNKGNIHRAQHFYDSLLPYTDGFSYRICDI